MYKRRKIFIVNLFITYLVIIIEYTIQTAILYMCKY